MANGRRVQVAATGLAALVLIAGILVAVTHHRQPPHETAELRPLVPAPLSVTLATLGSASKIAMGASTPVRVEAVGPGVDSVTLWEDDRALATYRVQPGTSTATVGHTFDWTAITPGPHVLHASAHGSRGTAHSAPISRTVAPAPNTPPTLVVRAPAGTTAHDFAVAHGIAPGLVEPAVATSSSDVGPDESDTHFTIDTVGVLEASTPPGSVDAADPGEAPTTNVATSDETGTLPPDTAPAPQPSQDDSTAESTGGPTQPAHTPVLSVALHGCTARVEATGSTTDMEVYALGAGTAGFTQFGKLEPGKSLEIGPLAPGVHVLTAGPPGSPTTTAPVSVTAPPSCVEAFWKGNASLTGGILTIPAPDDGLLSMYLSVDDQPASRIPPGNLRLFRASTRNVDVTPYLPTLTGSKLHLEVWSTDPDTNRATKIATGDATLPDGMLPAELIGESGTATLTITPTKAKVADQKITGRWTTPSTRPDLVVWQVTTQSVSPSNTSLAPPGLVASGISLALPAKTGERGKRGGFTIPIASLVRPPLTPVISKPVTHQQVVAAEPISNLPTTVAPVIADRFAIDPSAMLDSAVSTPELTGGVASSLPAPSSATFFIRVIPLAAGQPLGGASESVRFDGPTPTDPPQVALTPTKVTFDGGRAANPALAACVRVTALPWDWYDPHQTFSAFFPTPGTYCPGDWQQSSSDSCWLPDAVCDAWDVVTGAVTWAYDTATKVWDVIALVYNTIVDTAVDLVAKLNPYCISATLAAAGSGAIGFDKSVTDTAQGAAKLCDKIAHVVARAGVSAVLMSFGLPPELPTSDQLEAIARGDLTEVAVAYLEQLGVPCDDLKIDAATAGTVSAGVEQAGGDVPDGVADGVDVCRDAVGMVMGELESQVRTQVQQQIVNSTGLPLPMAPIDGFTFEMEPRGRWRAPSLTISATTEGTGIPSNAMCSAEVSGFQGWNTSPSQTFPTFRRTPMAIHRLLSSDIFFGRSSMAFNSAAGFDLDGQGLLAGTEVKAVVASDCLGDGSDKSYNAYVMPLMPRWHPGEGS